MEWVRRWEITIRWDSAHHSPTGSATFSTRVDTPADLRNLVERARRDPHVVAFPYKSVRELVGERPTECRNGHPYTGPSATRAREEWIVCGCGGHLVIRCHGEGCRDARVEPEPGPDCD